MIKNISINQKRNNQIFIYGDNQICITEPEQYKIPKNIHKYQHSHNLQLPKTTLESRETITLWDQNVNLKWKFNDEYKTYFTHPSIYDERKKIIKILLEKALKKWGKAAPIIFTESNKFVDFEIIIDNNQPIYKDKNKPYAKAFFPNEKEKKLSFYPKYFSTQKESIQLNIFIHELGHIFGLAHFSPKSIRIPYNHNENEESIMKEGKLGVFSEKDKKNLKSLYHQVWTGNLSTIDKIPIKLVTSNFQHT